METLNSFADCRIQGSVRQRLGPTCTLGGSKNKIPKQRDKGVDAGAAMLRAGSRLSTTPPSARDLGSRSHGNAQRTRSRTTSQQLYWQKASVRLGGGDGVVV